MVSLFDFAPTMNKLSGNFNATGKRRAMWEAMKGCPFHTKDTTVYTSGLPVAPQRVRWALPKGLDIA